MLSNQANKRCVSYLFTPPKSFIITKAGKPLVKVSRLDAPSAGKIQRLGFMVGQIAVPDDFDTIRAKEIERLFGYEE